MKGKGSPPPKPPALPPSNMEGQEDLPPQSSSPSSAVVGKRATSSSAPPSTMEGEGLLRSSPPPPLAADAVIGPVATENRVTLFTHEASGSSSVPPIEPIMSIPLAKHGSKQAISSAKNEANTQAFSSLHVDDMVQDTEWDKLEAYVKSFIPVSNPVECHPMLFLSTRMSRVVDLIVKKKNFLAAEDYYEKHMKSFFGKLIEQGQIHRNANIEELSAGLLHIAKCLDTRESSNVYTTNPMTKIVVNDYMRVYLPQETGYIVRRKKDAMWAFGFQLPSKSPSKPTIRCMVCSVKVFNSGKIKDLTDHLRGCPRMNTVYVIEQFELYSGMKLLNNTQTQSAAEMPMRCENVGMKRPRTDFTSPASTSMPAESRISWQEFRQRFIVGAEDLHVEIGKEVDGVVDLHTTMARKVHNIAGMHFRMGGLVKKIKSLAFLGHSDPGSTETEDKKENQDDQNNVEVKEADDAHPRFDSTYLASELMEQMRVNPIDPTSELMEGDKMIQSFKSFDGNYFD